MVASFKALHGVIEPTESEDTDDAIDQMVTSTMGDVSKEMSVEKTIVDLVMEQLVARQLVERSGTMGTLSDVDSTAPATMEVVQEDPNGESGTESSAVASVAAVTAQDAQVDSESDTEGYRRDISNTSSFISHRIDV